MTKSASRRCRFLVLWGAACAGCLLHSGCGDPSTSAAITPRAEVAEANPQPAESPPLVGELVASEVIPPVLDDSIGLSALASGAEISTVSAAIEPIPSAFPKTEPPSPPKERTFSIEADGALRVGFDDLDLLKILKMDPVTPDCVEKMPGWLRGLSGKQVRIRGFMKPGLLLKGIPQFLFVRDTGLCCFGPKGKIYDMIAVTLKAGTTTDYIDLRPFDVVGTFKIEMLQLDDAGPIYGLYYIDDAVIVQK